MAVSYRIMDISLAFICLSGHVIHLLIVYLSLPLLSFHLGWVRSHSRSRHFVIGPFLRSIDVDAGAATSGVSSGVFTVRVASREVADHWSSLVFVLRFRRSFAPRVASRVISDHWVSLLSFLRVGSSCGQRRFGPSVSGETLVFHSVIGSFQRPRRGLPRVSSTLCHRRHCRRYTAASSPLTFAGASGRRSVFARRVALSAASPSRRRRHRLLTSRWLDRFWIVGASRGSPSSSSTLSLPPPRRVSAFLRRHAAPLVACIGARFRRLSAPTPLRCAFFVASHIATVVSDFFWQ